MIRVGAVNIDTSHPMGFGEVMESNERARYVGVYNDSFRDEEEVNGFIHRFGLEKRCDSLEELAELGRPPSVCHALSSEGKARFYRQTPGRQSF